MRERPILMSGGMVRAILNGRKTQTRRIIANVTREDVAGQVVECIRDVDGLPSRLDLAPLNWECCPYGVPGDRLWVKETWAAESHWDNVEPARIFQRLPGKHAARVHFMADGPKPDSFGKTRVSLFMPKAASRITLEIVETRVQRLHEITGADAYAEGCSEHGPEKLGLAVNAFAHLWRDINGSASWEANHWVWAISFRRINQPTERP